MNRIRGPIQTPLSKTTQRHRQGCLAIPCLQPAPLKSVRHQTGSAAEVLLTRPSSAARSEGPGYHRPSSCLTGLLRKSLLSSLLQASPSSKPVGVTSNTSCFLLAGSNQIHPKELLYVTPRSPLIPAISTRPNSEAPWGWQPPHTVRTNCPVPLGLSLFLSQNLWLQEPGHFLPHDLALPDSEPCLPGCPGVCSQVCG